MKFSKIFSILLFSTVIALYSCNEKSNSSKKVEETPRPFVSPTPKPSNNIAGVYHYICSKGCAGGAGAAGNCSTCGSALTHNQAFHNNTNSTPTNTPSTPTNTPLNSQATDSGQNAAGVWHYTCTNGCAGGAGAAGNCSTCGSALAHNQSYH